ncbi:MAG: DUF488 family protein [Candidatus Manganitrophus sp.]|nr:DUF488 family protein [Candidatus Manganitrophus sp.]WDT70733.1 MAG: DUF488 family protein [Candidatus Manganitrophus sp.]
MLKTKSIHSPLDPKRDGLRILVARFRGRGIKKDRYDVWMANLGPSEPLLRGFLNEEIDWKTYTRRYKAEMFQRGGADRRNRVIRNHGQKFTLRLIKKLAETQPVTLLCHCAEEEKQCHRHLLKEIILSRKV